MADARLTAHDPSYHNARGAFDRPLRPASVEPHVPTDDHNAELLEALREREPEASGTLLRRYENRLLNSAMKITRNREDAEDAVQSTFLQLYRHIDGFRGESQFSSWLTRILINQSLAVLRRRSTINVSTDDWTGDEDHPVPRELKASCDTPEENFLKQEHAERLRAVLTKLPAPCQRVAQLHYLEQLSYEEIAISLGISLSAVKSRLFRARKSLRRDGRVQLDPPRRVSGSGCGRS